MKPAVERQQRAALRLGQWLLPSTHVGITIRDTITRVATWPSVASVLRYRLAVQNGIVQG